MSGSGRGTTAAFKVKGPAGTAGPSCSNDYGGSAIRSAALATLIMAALTRLLAGLVLTAALLLLAWLLSTATLLLTRAGIVLLLLVGILLVRIVHD